MEEIKMNKYYILKDGSIINVYTCNGKNFYTNFSNSILINSEFKNFEDSDIVNIITVTILKHGQERRYGDSYYYYDIVYPGATSEDVISFLEKTLETNIKNMNNEIKWWAGTYTLQKNNDVWEYRAKEPYLD